MMAMGRGISFYKKSFSIMFLLAVIGGFAFCGAMDAHHGILDMGSMANCSMAHFASVLLPLPISDRMLLLFAASFLSFMFLVFLRRIFEDGLRDGNPRFPASKTHPLFVAIYDPIRDIMRRGIMHPRLYNCPPAF